MTAPLDIRPMSRADLDTALGWAATEGWNPGLDDADAFFAQDPYGFLMGRLGSEKVGCISVVKYGRAFGFLGLYIVRPESRGRGYGKAIWDAGIASAAGRTIGLDGVVAQQDNYRKSGFAFAHRSARWSGRPAATTAPPDHLVSADDHLDAVIAYDRRHFPSSREPFLALWLKDSPLRHSLALLVHGSIAGYGTLRRAVGGWKVGPLFADHPEVASSILTGLIHKTGGDPIAIDIPAPNEAAAALAQRLGLTPSFETARMYLGPPPSLPLEHIFGITTLELG